MSALSRLLGAFLFLFRPVSMRKWLASLAFLMPLICYGQSAPSLSAGINEVSYTKGKLDAELIAEIISTKRGEIKVEVARRLIIKRFESSSFAVQNYVSNTVNLLLTETNKEIIAHGMLKNSAELMMVYAFSEFYLKELSSRSLETFEEAFMIEMIKWSDPSPDNQRRIKENFGMIGTGKSQSQLSKGSGLVVTSPPDGRSNVGLFNAIDEIDLLNLFANTAKSFKEDNTRVQNIAPIHIFVDMVFEALRTDERVRAMGFFRNVDETQNNSYNKFLLFKNSASRECIFKSIAGATSAHETGLVVKAIKNRISNVFRFYRSLSQSELSRSRKDLTIEKIMAAIDEKLKGFGYDPATHQPTEKAISEFEDMVVNDLYQNLEKVDSSRFSTINLTESEKKILTDLNEMADNLWTADFVNDVEQLEFYRLKLETTLRHPLTVINVKYGSAFTPAIKTIDDICYLIRQRGMLELRRVVNEALSKRGQTSTDVLNFFEHFQLYTQIVYLINNLDRANSYDEIFRFLTTVSNTLGSDESRTILSHVTKAFDTYAILNREDNKITLDVESMALDLFDRYGENNSQLLSMYFSVGINTSYTNKENYSIDSKPIDGNFSYVSEKIGLKVIPPFVDFNRRYSVRKKPNKPIISNFYLLAYTSGLLYQVDALTTDDNFKSILAGGGVGLSFFNGLDLNLTVATPLTKPEERAPLFNLGFDIRIFEYLGALKKKKGLTQN